MRAIAFLLRWSVALVAWPVLAAAVGRPAPPFTLPGASGKPIALEAVRGKVVYVDFWASSCGPCRRSFPWMNRLQARYAGEGLAIGRSTSTSGRTMR